MASVATYGGYPHPDNEVNLVSLDVQTIYSPRNKRLAQRKTVSLYGEIQDTSLSAILTRIQAIENAYSQDNLDFRYTVNGSLSHSLLNNGQCLSGVKVLRRPSFPQGDATELVNKRTFAIVLQATYDAAETDLVSWTESIETIGTGGPKFQIVETEFLPVAVYSTINSAQYYHQIGTAIGYSGYPNPPGPVNPDGEFLDRRRITRVSGRNMGNQIRHFTTRWSYFMVRDVGTFGQVDFFPTSQ